MDKSLDKITIEKLIKLHSLEKDDIKLKSFIIKWLTNTNDYNGLWNEDRCSCNIKDIFNVCKGNYNRFCLCMPKYDSFKRHEKEEKENFILNNCEYCFELNENCICSFDECSICKKIISNWDQNNKIFEYRGILSCKNCIDIAIKNRDFDRQEIINESKHRTDIFNGLDLSDSIIGKSNRKILKTNIEIAKKENFRLKEYEK